MNKIKHSCVINKNNKLRFYTSKAAHNHKSYAATYAQKVTTLCDNKVGIVQKNIHIPPLNYMHKATTLHNKIDIDMLGFQHK